jgi:hypothetical protein
VRKIKLASAGKCIAVAVACAGIAAESVKARRLFLPGARLYTLIGP